MATPLSFERPLIELRKKIDELKSFTADNTLDFHEEIARLEERYGQLEKSIYDNLTLWQKVQIVRHGERPTTLDYIRTIFTDFVELHGDRVYGDDRAIVGGIAKLEGLPVTVIGHQKGRDTKDNIRRNFGMPHPEGYRKAHRLMEQANKFGRPIVTFIDTPGAYPGKGAEERGQSFAIAQNIRDMAGLDVPIVSVVTGEGSSGGALGIGVGDVIMLLEHAYYSVIAPESAASILWKDVTKAEQAAESLKIYAQHVVKLGVGDRIIPEPRGGAHKDPEAQALAIKNALLDVLPALLAQDAATRRDKRYEKYKKIGKLSVLSGSVDEKG